MFSIKLASRTNLILLNDKKTMKNNLPKICYWCGIPLTKETNKREHVPPAGFFPEGYREKLITIPACERHNNGFSSLDERFQIYIKALGTNLVAVTNFKDSVLRGLNREQSKKLVASLSQKSFHVEINGEQRLVMEIAHGHQQRFVEKIIRGIYFYHKEIPAEGTIQSFSPQFQNPDMDMEKLADYLLEDLSPEYMIKGDYNNPEVFSYQYQEVGNIFVLVLNFYEGAQFIGWVMPN